MEDYAAKMQLKSDAALREYVTGHAQYRDEAVLAALDELRRRGQPAPEEVELRPPLEATVRQQAEAARQAEVAAAPENLPVLYSPIGILISSAVVSVVMGAVLLALNMQRLRRTSAIVGLVVLVLAYLVAESLVYQWLVRQFGFNPLLASLLDLPLMLAYVWWFWPRYVGIYQFRSRNWVLPLGICVVLKLGLFIYLFNTPAVQQMLKQQMEQLQHK